MTTVTCCTRFPEELKELPAFIGEKEDERVILFNADVDGFQRISEEETGRMICNYLRQPVPLSVFIDLMRRAGNVLHL